MFYIRSCPRVHVDVRRDWSSRGPLRQVLALFHKPQVPPIRKLTDEQLRDKALLALEDAVQECRYRTPRPSFAVRFALAYLWAYAGCRDGGPFLSFWVALKAEKSPWNFSCADGELLRIYAALGIERPPDIGMTMWKRWAERERQAGGKAGTGHLQPSFHHQRRETMADDKSNVGAADRPTVAKGEVYEVTDFAQKHGITAEQARGLIDRHGNNREELDRAAARLGGR
jgi:hypothetical protein